MSLNNGLQIGMRLAVEGAQRAEARAEATSEGQWRAAALTAVFVVASERNDFTADDVWQAIKGFKYDESHKRDNRAMGSVLLEAARLQYCKVTDRTRKTSRGSNHARPLTVWESLL